jgi:putative NADH-flavin reductase
MNITIFGATGRTGVPLVKQALDAGHAVVALVRNPSTLSQQGERLTLVQGDVCDPSAVEQVIQGTDAVISVLGHRSDSPADLQTVATRHIVAAMRRYGVKRLVSLTGAGVAAPQDQPKLINHLISLALKTVSPDVLRDAEQQAEIIKHSDLEWVIVRGPRLNDGPPTGKYRVGWVGVNTSTRIARADVADFLLKQVTDTTYLHQLPMISA